MLTVNKTKMFVFQPVGTGIRQSEKIDSSFSSAAVFEGTTFNFFPAETAVQAAQDI